MEVQSLDKGPGLGKLEPFSAGYRDGLDGEAGSAVE